jgi:hypothetical protein
MLTGRLYAAGRAATRQRCAPDWASLLRLLAQIEWDGDVVTGAVIAGIGLAHMGAGYAFPRRLTFVVVVAMWLAATAGVDVVWALTGWDPYGMPRHEPECDPCVPASFGFLFVLAALPLGWLGAVVRRRAR